MPVRNKWRANCNCKYVYFEFYVELMLNKESYNILFALQWSQIVLYCIVLRWNEENKENRYSGTCEK